MKLNILIFEDESLTADRLKQLLGKLENPPNVLGVLESVKQGIRWFNSHSKADADGNEKGEQIPDLILMDIHLSDGSCFEIFNEVDIDIPIIFTTAYDEYATRAFKVNSVDYLLKPIDFNELKSAFQKFSKYNRAENESSNRLIATLYDQINRSNSYKQHFLVKIGEQFKRINYNDISYFTFEDSIVWANGVTIGSLPMDYSLNQLEEMLDPKYFFRINRKIILNINSIDKIHTYFNSRLKLNIVPNYSKDVIVSRERVGDFKIWLE